MQTKKNSPADFSAVTYSSTVDVLNSSVFSSILEKNGILVACMELDTTLLYAGNALEPMLGFRLEELVGKKFLDFVHPDDKKKSRSRLAYYTKKFDMVTVEDFISDKDAPVSERFDYRIRDKLGNWLWLETVGSIVDGKIYTISRNVTAKKEADFVIAESGKYDLLRAKVWKIAADKSLNADQLIQKLLDLIGPAFKVSRACYNRFERDDPLTGDLINVLEWCDKKVKPTVGSKLPSALVKHFIQDDFTNLTPDKAFEMIPAPQRALLKPLVQAVAKAQNIASFAMLPHTIEGTVVGILSFDVCRNKKEKPVWTDEKISIIRETVNIVSSHIIQKDAESALVKANRYNSLRAEVWRLAYDKSLSEDELIQGLLDLIGPVVDVSRACYNRFIGDDPYKSDLEVVFEWCADKVKPSLHTRQPSLLVRHFLKEEFTHLTPETAVASIAKPQRLFVAPLIYAMAKALNLHSISIVPHYIDEKPVGIWAFDVCNDKVVKPDWSEELISIVKEAVKIVSSHIAYKKTEAELAKHRHNLEDMVVKRTVEIVEANRKLKKEIAERKKTEAALRRAEKMEAVGLLAGGVAHDLNNILSGLVSCPDLLLHELPSESSLRETVEAIKMSGTKAAAVVQDLLLLSKTSFTDTGVVDLNSVVRDYTQSLEFKRLQSSRQGIFFQVDLTDGKVRLVGSPIHISKVLMNLVLNAAEAIPAGGTVSVTTRRERLDAEKTGYEVIEPGEYAVLRVADTGRGISKADMQRIFEPFYTKKVLNRAGTGLGLSIVWRTIKDYKGFVDIQSEEDKGTTFDLYFPLTTKQAEDTGAIKLELEMYMGRGEKILVVDDVEQQRQIALKLLKKLNYDALAVAGGEEAVAYLRDNEVDVIVLDMIMHPGIDGFETYRRIVEFRPNQKAIITSGFSETLRVKKTQKLGAGAYVQKPYSMEALGMALRIELSKNV